MAEIHGYCDDAFTSVREAFAQNFASRGEVGACVSIQIDNTTVVDLWGGEKAAGGPWEKDTMSLVFSCTKAAVALCAHILIDRGQLALDALVSTYWPDFAQNGKESVTVRMMLNHSSGVPAVRMPVRPGGFYDFDYMTGRLAKEKPYWEPGTTHGYHMVTFGWTVGELVRRVSGKSLGTFFKDEIAGPLGLDFYIGLPESAFPRTSKMIPYVPDPRKEQSDFVKALLGNPLGLQFQALLNTGGYLFDSKAAWKAEIGGGGGVSNARSLAAMFAPLASRNANTFLSAERIADLATVSSETERDETLLIPTRFGQGVMLRMDNRKNTKGEGNSAIIGHNGFGHVGMGGSIGFADPDVKMGFGYSMNNMGGGILLNERGQAVVDAAYEALGQPIV